MNVSVPTSLLVRWLFTGASLAVAGIVDCITLETRQGWLRMLVCDTALYREAVFTVRVAGTVSVVATYLLIIDSIYENSPFKNIEYLQSCCPASHVCFVYPFWQLMS